MPILYYGLSPLKSLTKDPYYTMAEKNNRIRECLDGQEIEISLGEKEGFAMGFYSSGFMSKPLIKFIYADLDSAHGAPEESTFIRMTFSFQCGDDNYLYYKPKIQALKKRADFLYIPMASDFGFSAQLEDDRFNLNFDTVVYEKHDVLQVCYCLLNLIIALFAFED